jgi:hypothetical protein
LSTEEQLDAGLVRDDSYSDVIAAILGAATAPLRHAVQFGMGSPEGSATLSITDQFVGIQDAIERLSQLPRFSDARAAAVARSDLQLHRRSGR